MGETMIRKQVYLGRAQDRKLKRLATKRGCTESELIREAIDKLSADDDDWVEQMRAAGVLAPKPVFDDLPTGEEAERLMAELDAYIENDTTDYRMTEALQEDRADRF